jgi:RNA polymerase sigma factor (sigma-70 family)
MPLHDAEPAVASLGPVSAPTRGCDPDRWANLWTHRARLVALARQRVDSREDAEDLAHDALLRAVTSQVELEGLSLGAWLTTVTKNLCVDHLRRRGRARRAVELLSGGRTTPGPEEDVIERAEAAWICEHVSALPIRQRAALELRARGMSVYSIAATLGVSYKAAEALLAHARAGVRLRISQSRQEISG